MMPATAKGKVLYVELDIDDRAKIERLAANSSAAVGHLVSMTDVVRQLIRDASDRATPVRVRRGRDG